MTMTASQPTAQPIPTPAPAGVGLGATLYFETVGAAGDGAGALRIRPDEDTLLRVISGTLRLTVGNVEHLLGPGGEAIVPAGFHHTLCAISGEARVVTGFRSARTR
jgi:mannose-6-phosphate isomerase-like protein (cupin superfamily)